MYMHATNAINCIDVHTHTPGGLPSNRYHSSSLSPPYVHIIAQTIIVLTYVH